MNEHHSQATESNFNLKPILGFACVSIGLMLLYSAYAWYQIPMGEKVPVHWGVDGQPDRYGSKLEGLFLMPLICIGLTALFCGIPYIEPRRFNLKSSWKAYSVIISILMLFLTAIHFITVSAALGHKINMNTVMPIALGGIFIVIGNYMGKIRSNFFCGIRTPWTLSSELSWNKTHRLGGKLFMALGIILMLVPLFSRGNFPVFLVVGGAVLLVATVFVYSYIVWRNDPNKQVTGR